jgi:acyl carrier protein
VNADAALVALARLLRQIAPEADLTTVDPDARYQDELDLDSMDFLNLVTAVHEELGVDIPERDYPRLATVRGFVTYLADPLAASA